MAGEARHSTQNPIEKWMKIYFEEIIDINLHVVNALLQRAGRRDIARLQELLQNDPQNGMGLEATHHIADID